MCLCRRWADGCFSNARRLSLGQFSIAARPHVRWLLATVDTWCRVEAEDAASGGCSANGSSSGGAVAAAGQGVNKSKSRQLLLFRVCGDSGAAARIEAILDACLLTDAEAAWGEAKLESRLANPFFPLEQRDEAAARGILAVAAAVGEEAANRAADTHKAAAAAAVQRGAVLPWSKREGDSTIFSSPAATDASIDGSSDVSERSADLGRARARAGPRHDMLLPAGTKKRLKPMRVLRRRKRELEAKLCAEQLSSLAQQEARDELLQVANELAQLAAALPEGKAEA